MYIYSDTYIGSINYIHDLLHDMHACMHGSHFNGKERSKNRDGAADDKNIKPAHNEDQSISHSR